MTKLAASFSIGCEQGIPRRQAVKGIVRLNSTVAFTALRITPAAIAWPVAHAFGTVPAGDSSETWGGTVENVGTSATSATASVTGAGYALAPGGCAGSLAVGSTCTLRGGVRPDDWRHEDRLTPAPGAGLTITDRSGT